MFPSGSSVSGTPFPLKPSKRDQCGDEATESYREHQSALPVTGNQLAFENEASSKKFLDLQVIELMLEMVEKHNSVSLGIEVYKAF